jgi:hypothetical protein
MAVNLKGKRRARKRRRRLDERDEVQHTSANATGLALLQQQIGNQAVQRMLAQRERETEPVKPAEAVKFPSGASWVEKFPTSDDPHHLDSEFRSLWTPFQSVLETAGADVEILATQNPPERAYLTHWAWRIAKENYDPQQVPDMEGVNIRWWHGDMKTSRNAAWQMVHGYEISDQKEPPPLASLYTEGKAIVTRITWSGDLTLYRGDPTREQVITEGPWDAANPEVMRLAETYGFVPLLPMDPDEVHWMTGE